MNNYKSEESKENNNYVYFRKSSEPTNKIIHSDNHESHDLVKRNKILHTIQTISYNSIKLELIY